MLFHVCEEKHAVDRSVAFDGKLHDLFHDPCHGHGGRSGYPGSFPLLVVFAFCNGNRIPPVLKIFFQSMSFLHHKHLFGKDQQDVLLIKDGDGSPIRFEFVQTGLRKADKQKVGAGILNLAPGNLELSYVSDAEPGAPFVGTVKAAVGPEADVTPMFRKRTLLLQVQYFGELGHFISKFSRFAGD